MKFYRPISLLLTLAFGAVGVIFLLMPEQVLIFFNNLSAAIGMVQAPVTGFSLYLILAVGYMYLVFLLALLMFLHPKNKYFPLILAQGKLASSVLSFYFFFSHNPFLIYVTNGVVDGIIGIIALSFYFSVRKQRS